MTTAVAVRERPILFSGPMVRAILDESKTMTRRVVKPQPNSGPKGRMVELGGAWGLSDGDLSGEWRCPYGQAGDRLWVKETWYCPKQIGGSYQREKLLHREDFEAKGHVNPPKWKSPRFMPRQFSRITLEITDVRVERVQEISEEDARAEGVDRLFTYRGVFQGLWNVINGPRGYGWDANPWVWVVSFRRVGQ